MKFGYLSLTFLLIISIVFPIIFVFNFTNYLEILIISILIRLILVYKTPKTYSLLTFNFLNYAQGIYLIFILIMWNFAYNDLGVLDLANLVGDDRSYFEDALIMSKEEGKSFLEYEELTILNYFLFQYILSNIIVFFKSHYLACLMFIMFTGLLNLLLLIKIGIILNFKKNTIKIISVFYIFFPHILSANIVLLKDSLLVFSLLLLVYSVLCFVKDRNNKIKLLMYIIISFILCFFLRLPFIILYLAILFYLLYTRKKSTVFNILLIVLCISFFQIYNYYFVEIIETVENLSQVQELKADSSSVYGSGISNTLVGNYRSDPLYLRIIKLPLVVLVQYLTPINIFNFSHIHPWSYIDINMKILWLIFYGPLFIFSLIQLKYFNGLIKKLLIISIVGYALIAFLETGIVPRYALIFMCLSIVPMAYIFHEIKNNVNLKTKYMFFKRSYFFLGLIFSCLYVILKL